VTIKGPQAFPDPAFKQYADEIATDERTHVSFHRSAGRGRRSRRSRQAIELLHSFNTRRPGRRPRREFDYFDSEGNF